VALSLWKNSPGALSFFPLASFSVTCFTMLRRTFIIYLILTAVIGFSVYLIVTAVIRSSLKPFTGSVRDAIESCGTSRLPAIKTPLEQDSLLEENPSSLSLEVGTIQLTASANFLTAKTEGGKVEVAVSQPDYGTVRSLHRTQSGEIFAIGDQISYRFKASVDNGIPVLTTPAPLPFLFPETCGLFGRITRSCPPNSAIYSHELEAIFLHGRASSGSFMSVVLGLATGDRDLSHSGTPFFMGDIPSTGRVLLSGSGGFALFDGKVIVPCASVTN
jgi:hypothetical protein